MRNFIKNFKFILTIYLLFSDTPLLATDIIEPSGLLGDGRPSVVSPFKAVHWQQNSSSFSTNNQELPTSNGDLGNIQSPSSSSSFVENSKNEDDNKFAMQTEQFASEQHYSNSGEINTIISYFSSPSLLDAERKKSLVQLYVTTSHPIVAQAILETYKELDKNSHNVPLIITTLDELLLFAIMENSVDVIRREAVKVAGSTFLHNLPSSKKKAFCERMLDLSVQDIERAEFLDRVRYTCLENLYSYDSFNTDYTTVLSSLIDDPRCNFYKSSFQALLKYGTKRDVKYFSAMKRKTLEDQNLSKTERKKEYKLYEHYEETVQFVLNYMLDKRYMGKSQLEKFRLSLKGIKDSIALRNFELLTEFFENWFSKEDNEYMDLYWVPVPDDLYLDPDDKNAVTIPEVDRKDFIRSTL